jgi:bilirubin oxidase
MKIYQILLLNFLWLQAISQNPLYIPPSYTGSVINLEVQTGSMNFYDTILTPTFGINGPFLAPTIIVNKGDSVTLNVINNLPVKTTMHWHGMHVSAMNDGGPHQEINPNTTWSPSFKVRNNASTLWYHPHGAGQTDPQVSKGIAGMLIVKDSNEAVLNLPRNYGIDDIPLIIQTKAFDELGQIAIATDLDTSIFVNGTLYPYFNAPAQVVRFRLLNASSLRSFNFGLSNNQIFYQIATDGGLKDSSVALTRLLISPGERAEILIDFTGMQSQSIYFKSFASELQSGIYGSSLVGFGADTIHDYQTNYLNGNDFNLLQINIGGQTVNPILTLPVGLLPYTPQDPALATNYRTIIFDTLRLLPIDPPNRAEGPFGLNNKTFHMDSINEVVHINTIEIWTLVNKTLVAHPFHIHDIQFSIIEKGGIPPSSSEIGWKDVVLVMPNDSVKFITKFETFADNVTPYMYHCHLLHHEDDGMMGSFLVIDTNSTGLSELELSKSFKAFPNPATNLLYFISNSNEKFSFTLINSMGEKIYTSPFDNFHSVFDIGNYPAGLYYIQFISNNNNYIQKILKQ